MCKDFGMIREGKKCISTYCPSGKQQVEGLDGDPVCVEDSKIILQAASCPSNNLYFANGKRCLESSCPKGYVSIVDGSYKYCKLCKDKDPTASFFTNDLCQPSCSANEIVTNNNVCRRCSPWFYYKDYSECLLRCPASFHPNQTSGAQDSCVAAGSTGTSISCILPDFYNIQLTKCTKDSVFQYGALIASENYMYYSKFYFIWAENIVIPANPIFFGYSYELYPGLNILEQLNTFIPRYKIN